MNGLQVVARIPFSREGGGSVPPGHPRKTPPARPPACVVVAIGFSARDDAEVPRTRSWRVTCKAGFRPPSARYGLRSAHRLGLATGLDLSLIHISEPTRLALI
eukprot:5673457-Alexandrium_andersonii.AAC.1